MKQITIGLLLFSLLIPSAYSATREEKVRGDLKTVQATGNWIYNDLSKGKSLAQESGKPMLIVFRCIP